ncbi:nitrogenase component 1, partial [Rhizobium ruizarguesonis]
FASPHLLTSAEGIGREQFLHLRFPGFGAVGGKDLWAMRSLLLTEPVDLLIGNSYGKYLERDTDTPLVRLTFPIFDRHHHNSFPLMGYQGGLRLL